MDLSPQGKTAIVVSGILRYFEYASLSWDFDGDYFLIVEKNIYESQSQTPINDARNIISQVDEKINFKAITLCDSLAQIKKLHDIYDIIKNYPFIQQVWKWKLAYNFLLPYHQQNSYDRIILIRPDLWISRIASDSIESVSYNHLEIFNYGTIHDAPITDPITSAVTQKKSVLELLMMVNMPTFKILSEFYDYVIDIIRSDSAERICVHLLLAKYLIDNNIPVNDWFMQNYRANVIRYTNIHMFDTNGLRREYTMDDLIDHEQEFWKLVSQK